MLKTVIKRDGSKQEANPEKAISWSQWAAKGLGKRVDVPNVIRYVFSNLGEVETTKAINKALIERLVEIGNYPHLKAAGRLLAADARKEIFGSENLPKVSERFSYLKDLGYMRSFSYTEDEWATLDRIIDHERDFDLASFQVRQIVGKYSIKDSVTKKVFETPQFTFMRLAISLAEGAPKKSRLALAGDYYDAFSKNLLNQPTPNYSNLGTLNNGLASCCLSISGDSAPSLAAGGLILYTMTYSSAGTGHVNMTRSEGDPVRNGAIKHNGKTNYFWSDAKNVKANTQGPRGGACTEYVPAYDPEIHKVLKLQNPLTPIEEQNRDVHFSIQMNKFFIEAALADRQVASFNIYRAPDLTKAFYSGDREKFAEEHTKYVESGKVKTFLDARSIAVNTRNEGHVAGTVYVNFVDEMNRHTPFKETIYSSNLCGEAMMVTAPYESPEYLHIEEDHGKGEVALCSLGAINVALAHYLSDEEYAKLAYLAVRAADTCIDMAHYELKHIGFTAKRRRNVGIGVTGLATVMAKEGVRYSSAEGKALISKVFERHAYFCIKASLKLGKELGNAPWMHKTKWPEGWLPVDTYCRAVDEITPHVTHYDWEGLRTEILENKGIRNSVVINHMPGESSSKATGCPNGVYPVRDLVLLKSDADNILEWAAIDEDLLGDKYENAYSIPNPEHIKCYAVQQKWTDQGGSNDTYADRRKTLALNDRDLLMELALACKYGVKSLYYPNSLTNNGATVQEDNCTSGACKM